MADEFVITPDGRDRTVRYSTNPDDSYIEVEITAKESVDALNALDELVNDVEIGSVSTPLPVHDVRNMASGGIDLRNDSSLLLSCGNDIEVLLIALARHDPVEIDLTGQVFRAVIEAVDESPFDYDLEAFKETYNSHA